MNYKNFSEIIEFSLSSAIDSTAHYDNIDVLSPTQKECIYNILTHFVCEVVTYLDEPENAEELSAEFMTDFQKAKNEADCVESTLIDIDAFTAYLKKHHN